MRVKGNALVPFARDGAWMTTEFGTRHTKVDEEDVVAAHHKVFPMQVAVHK